MTTEAILKNTRFDTYTRTANKCKDTKINKSALLVGGSKNIKIKSCNFNKSDRNIGSHHRKNHLKSSKLNNRQSQTESEAYSDDFGNSVSSGNELNYGSEGLTNKSDYESSVENSNSFIDSEDELKKTELTMDIEQDVREIVRMNNQRNLLNRNAFKKTKLRSSLVDPKDITTMWEKIVYTQSRKNLTYKNIFYYQNGQKIYLKDLSPSRVVGILDEMAGSDAEKKKKISDLKEQFASLIQNDRGKLKNLKGEEEKFESMIFNLLEPRDFGTTQKIVVQAAILAEAVAVFLRDTFTEFAELSNDDIADAIIAAFLYKSKSDWLDGAEICRSSEDYVKKILASVSPDLDEQRCTRIINAIDHKNNPLFDSDGSIKKDLLAIILQITDHLDHHGNNIKLFDFTSKDYKIDNPCFNFSSLLPPEKVHARVITFLERASQFY